jgi:D-cysteine desulfhydrase
MSRLGLLQTQECFEALRAVFPAFSLIAKPTPLQHLKRFSHVVGAQVWIKRDEIGSFAIAGSKSRKLELVIEQAVTGGFDSLVTIGPPQSNTCRAVAAACASVGLRSFLVLSGDAPSKLSGNALIAAMLGASIHWAGSLPMSHLETTLIEYFKHLRSRGLNPMLIAPGCSNKRGVVGMAIGYAEMQLQAIEAGFDPRSIYHASATGGIWAGMRIGSELTGGVAPTPVLVFDDMYPDTCAAYAALYNSTAEELGVGGRLDARDVVCDSSMVEVGYANADSAVIDAIALLARTEGIICDPYYSGKALAALVAHARNNTLPTPALFWHTGGIQVLGDPTAAVLLNRNIWVSG